MLYKQVREVGINIGALYTHSANEFSGKANPDAGTLTLGCRLIDGQTGQARAACRLPFAPLPFAPPARKGR